MHNTYTAQPYAEQRRVSLATSQTQFFLTGSKTAL